MTSEAGRGDGWSGFTVFRFFFILLCYVSLHTVPCEFLMQCPCFIVECNMQAPRRCTDNTAVPPERVVGGPGRGVGLTLAGSPISV